jgi:hypothetical protein
MGLKMPTLRWVANVKGSSWLLVIVLFRLTCLEGLSKLFTDGRKALPTSSSSSHSILDCKLFLLLSFCYLLVVCKG